MDPVLVRVAFVVLAIFGGGGILLYLAGWLFIPADGEEVSAGERFFRDNTTLAVIVAVLLAMIVVGPLLAWGWWGDGPGLLGVSLIVLAVVLIFVALDRRRASPDAGLPLTGPAAPGPVGPAAYPAAPPPVVPRERSVLGRVTVSVALVVVGTLIALDLANVAAVGAVTVLSATLLVVSAGLLLGTWIGRSRGLIWLGVVLVAVLVPVAAVPDSIDFNGGAGERSFAPTTASELASDYQLGAGDMVLDLRRLELGGTTETVRASVGAGQLQVLLPAGLDAVVRAGVGVGDIVAPDIRDAGGFGVDRAWTLDAEPSDGAVVLDLEVGLGEISVDYPSTTMFEVTR